MFCTYPFVDKCSAFFKYLCGHKTCHVDDNSFMTVVPNHGVCVVLRTSRGIPGGT